MADEHYERIVAAVAALAPMVTNETHAWNLWNLIASDRGAIREALTAAWADEWEWGVTANPTLAGATRCESEDVARHWAERTGTTLVRRRPAGTWHEAPIPQGHHPDTVDS